MSANGLQRHHKAPGIAADKMPGMALGVGPDMAPGVGPDMAPGVGPDRATGMAADKMPGMASGVGPDKVPDMAPGPASVADTGPGSDTGPDRHRERRLRGMVRVPGGTFRMGSDNHYPEEAPAHRVTVNAFWIDATPVTNAQFRRFVKATGHVTVAERTPDPRDYPGARPEMLFAGSLVFAPRPGIASLRDWSQWWEFRRGADWRHPYGRGSNIHGRDDHPVVHVAHADALAYARWAGKDLPTEAEWEYAARGGLEGAEFAWGDEFAPGGRQMANTWQGDFPVENLALDGHERTSPVTAFPANGHGLHDMIGNCWEWTQDWFSARHPAEAAKACCIPENPRGGPMEASFDPAQPRIRIPRKVIKGGSHLCAPNYCRRYRPAARHAEAVDTSTSHLGFRCLWRGEE